MKRVISIGISFVLFVSCLFIVNVGAAESCLLGDVNADGIISIADAHYVYTNKNNYSTLNNEYDVLGDVDLDSSYTNKDVIAILKIAAGISSTESLDFSEWTIITSPSCTSSGLETSYCESRGITRSRVIPKTAHSFVNNVCSLCGYKNVENNMVNVYNKSISFGAAKATIIETFGNPTELLYDTDGTNNYEYYVYADNYSKLAIFMYTSGVGLTGFYTNDVTSGVVIGNEIYTINNLTQDRLVDDIYIYPYVDGIGSNQCYAINVQHVNYKNIISEHSNFGTNSKLVFHTTNGCRAINGIAPLDYCEEVAEVALYHSKDMANNNYFSHNAPNGETVADRLALFEIEWMGYGENIMAGYPLIAYDFTNGWYNSEGHRRNVLYEDFSHLGVAFAYNEESDYNAYSTQNFLIK